MESIKITVLSNNHALEGFETEHGFSLRIETPDHRVLFDTGQHAVFLNNARKLGVPVQSTEILVLSHGHYDHAGGLPALIERAPAVNVYCHPGVRQARFSVRDREGKPIGMSASSIAALEGLPADQVHETVRPLELADGLGITGEIPRLNDYETTGGPFFLDESGRAADPIPDDMAMWMRTPKGLVVVLGCGHAGIINTLDYIGALTNGAGVHAVIGGFHLVEASRERIDRTVDALEEISPDLLIPCHCTGDTALLDMQEAFGERLVIGKAGATYTFG